MRTPPAVAKRSSWPWVTSIRPWTSRAQAELKRIQEIEILAPGTSERVRPYEKMAMLAPPLDWKMAGRHAAV